MPPKTLNKALQSEAGTVPRRSTRNRKTGDTEADGTMKNATDGHAKSQPKTTTVSKVQVPRKRNNSDVADDTEPSQAKSKRSKSTKASKPKATAAHATSHAQAPRRRPPKAPDYDKESDSDNNTPLSRKLVPLGKSAAVTSNEGGSIPASRPASNLSDLRDDDVDAFSQESSDSDKQSSDNLSSLSETDDDDLSRLINGRASGAALADALAKEQATWVDEMAQSQTPVKRQVTVPRTSRSTTDIEQASSHLPSKLARKAPQADMGGRRKSDWDKRRAERPVWNNDAQGQPVTLAPSTPKASIHIIAPKAEQLTEFDQPRKASDLIVVKEATGGSTTVSHDPVDSTADDDIQIVENPQVQAPPRDDSIELVFSPNSTELNLSDQHERVARLLRATIKKVLLDVVFEDAFPDQPLRHVIVPNALIAVARGLNDPELVARVRNDTDYCRALVKIPAQRVSNFRGDFKKKTDGLVDGYYDCSTFPNAEKLQEAIDWLKEEGMYHYPCNPKMKTFEANKPFQHPIIESTFKLTLFQKPTSFGFAHCVELCESSLPDKPDEKELPMAMVAFIATSVYASLNNWANGVRKTADFESSLVCDAYKTNIALLEAIKSKSAKKYHTLMHTLFKKATGQVDTRGKGKSSAVERALRAVDIDAMADSETDI